MSRQPFDDRLDPQTYAGDPVVGVYEHGPDDADALWIPERLFARLTCTAAGYEMHTLPMLGGEDTVVVERSRCSALLDEIAFVADRLDDPLATQVSQHLYDYISRRTNNPLWDGAIVVEGE